MKHPIYRLLFGLLLVTGLALCSCSAHRKLAVVPPPQSEPVARHDSLSKSPSNLTSLPDKPASTSGAQKGLLGRIFSGKTASAPIEGYILAGAQSSTIPRKCKGCTFNVVAGNQTNSTVDKKATAATAEGATATVIEKAKAPVATGTGDATDQAGAGAASTIKGNDNAPVLTNTAPKAPGVGATIAGAIATPVGKAVAVLLLASIGFGVYKIWPVLRRKEPTKTQA